jgi:hypothetical protein
MNGKGSRRRPTEVPPEVFEDNWSRTFGKKPPEGNLACCAFCCHVFRLPLDTFEYTCPCCGREGPYDGD